MNETALTPATGAAILGVFSLVWIALGWYWGRRSSSFEGHALAGRNVGLALATATAMATWVTSNTTMAAPQLAYQLGIWGMIGYSLGAVGLLLFAPMAERVRSLMPRGYTSGDFIHARYGRACWTVFLLISLLYALGWLVSMGTAAGVLLDALTGTPYRVGMAVITIACGAYTLLGGLHAVIGTDFVQSSLILGGLVVVGVAVFSTVDLGDVHAQLARERPALLDLLAPAALLFLFNNLLFGVGEIFHSNVWWSRAFAFRPGVGRRAFRYAGLVWLPVPIAAGAIALVAPALGLNVPALDMVGPLVVGEVLGTAGAVVLLVVVLSSLASSLDSLLAATSDLLVNDVYRRLLRPAASSRQLTAAGRRVTIVLTLLTVAVCWARVTTLAELIQFTGAFVASTIWPIAAGLYWRDTNPTAATAGLLAGSICGVVAYFAIGFYVAALVGAATSMLVVVVGTWTRPRPFDWDRLDNTEPASEHA